MAPRPEAILEIYAEHILGAALVAFALYSLARIAMVCFFPKDADR
jgi:hypothetical protein